MSSMTPDPTLVALDTAIGGTLRAMDEYAAIQGHTAGLRDFAHTIGLGQKKYYEDIWSAALAERLRPEGYPSTTQERFPADPKKRCDIVFDVDGCAIWLELKVIWKAWYDLPTASVGTKNRSDQPYLIGGEHKDHSVLGDVKKLERLAPADAALVVKTIAFDAPTVPVSSKLNAMACGAATDDLANLFASESLAARDWLAFHPHGWTDRRDARCRCTVTNWMRPRRLTSQL